MSLTALPSLHVIDDQTYLIRFTPRRPLSIWSAVNIAKVERLRGEGRMTPAGEKALHFGAHGCANEKWPTGVPDLRTKYPALLLRARSTCPTCRSEVQTDLRTVGIVETIIGAPLLWLLAALLRTGTLSYALLFPVALLFIFWSFVGL
jgi:hypothetical protein